LCDAIGDVGAKAHVIDIESPDAGGNIDTLVIQLPQTPQLDDYAAAAEVATFFGNRGWWPGVNRAVTDCWLVTVGREAVIADDDASPDPVHAAASAGFRCLGAEHPGVGFRHLDLPAESTPSELAVAILTALHTREESELVLRNDGLYAKRIVEGDTSVADADTDNPDHVLIIGGTGNLGLEFCDHFARGGARRITLVSRSGETSAVAHRLQQIRSATPTQIHAAKCDVGDQAAVSLLAKQHQDTPVDLIIHAAVEYSGNELADITTESVDSRCAPRLSGSGEY
jgi:mycobactin polyketide synthetase MbtD